MVQTRKSLDRVRASPLCRRRYQCYSALYLTASPLGFTELEFSEIVLTENLNKSRKHPHTPFPIWASPHWKCLRVTLPVPCLLPHNVLPAGVRVQTEVLVDWELLAPVLVPANLWWGVWGYEQIPCYPGILFLSFTDERWVGTSSGARRWHMGRAVEQAFPPCRLKSPTIKRLKITNALFSFGALAWHLGWTGPWLPGVRPCALQNVWLYLWPLPPRAWWHPHHQCDNQKCLQKLSPWGTKSLHWDPLSELIPPTSTTPQCFSCSLPPLRACLP